MSLQYFRQFKGNHNDYITDIAYDYYGKRLATCSSDQKVKIWDQGPNGQWFLTKELSPHSGPVQTIAWAHPEFGQIIATGSSDRQVMVLIESTSITNQNTWSVRTLCTDCQAEISDIEFAPHSSGLKLAVGSRDGFVRFYEAHDMSNLGAWTRTSEFEADTKDVFSISCCPSPFCDPMIAVGSRNSVKIWEWKDSYRRWVVVAECKGHLNDLNDVAWAPNLGRSFHLIATACKDGRIRIFKLKRKDSDGQLISERISELDAHNAEVWRVKWNITGTILASTGDDGKIRLWKPDKDYTFVCSMVARAEQLSSQEITYELKQ